MDVCDIRLHNGAPTLHINGEPVFAPMLTTNKNPHNTGNKDWRPDPYFEDFYRAGFRLFQIQVEGDIGGFDRCYDPQTDSFPSEGYDYSCEVLAEYARRCPGIKVLLRIMPEPRGKNSKWLQMHPEQMELMEEKWQSHNYENPSYASDLWLNDACRYIKRFGEELIARGLGDNVLGFLIGGGNSCEWVKSGPMEDWASDYSEPMQIGFRNWLKEKYGTDEALRAAWGKDDISLEDDLVPSPEAQNATELFLFKHPVRHRDSIDHYEYLAHRVAYDICKLSGAVKEVSNRSWLAGVFYGYLQEMVWNDGFFGQGDLTCDTEHSAAARSGHAGFAEVLASPDVDFFCSPYGYGFRGTGGEGGFMSPYESVRIAGKLWMSEEDFRSLNWDPDSGYGQPADLEEQLNLLKRQFSNILIHQSSAWWCDWCKPTMGSYDDPTTMKLFERMVKLGQHNIKMPHRETAAEIAIVIDAESSFYRSTLNNIDIPNWRARGWAMARMGAPVDFVMLSDILEGRAKEYKMYYMLNTFHLSDENRAKLKGILERDNKMTLFIYAPGYASDETLDVENVSKLTGMNVILRPRRWSVNIMPTNFEDPIMKATPTSMFWGTDMQLGPIFAIDTKGTDAVPLATSVAQQGRFETGFAIARRENYTYAYSVAPLVPACILREMAREAGVHIYNNDEDVIYAGHDYVMLHTVRTGKKTITLPRTANVVDAFSGEAIADNVNEFSFDMKGGETKLFYFGDLPIED